MQTEIINQIKHLPIAERIEIIEEVSRSVKEDLQKNGEKSNSIKKRKKAVDRLRGIASVARKTPMTVEEKLAAVEKLHGIAAVEGKTPPTDEEIKEDYINYISEKYK